MENKKIFISLFTTIIFVCMLLCACTKPESPKDDLDIITERGTLIVGVRDDAAPFGYKDKDGNLIGYDIDLAKVITKSLLGDEKKLQLVPVKAYERIRKLSSGEVDMLIATMSITPQRQIIMNFSRPYYVAGQAILVRNTCKYTKLPEFSGKRLIVVFGSTSEDNLRDNAPEVDVIGYRTYQDAFKALKEGKAEGIVADDTILMSYALKDKSVKLLETRYTKEPYAIAFRRETESQELLEKVDYIIEYLQETGKLDKMQEKWGL